MTTTQKDSPGPGRRWGPPATARARAKHEKILEAAAHHFARHGYEPSRVEDIAARMGISKASVFQYFATKAELFLAVYKKYTPTLGTYLGAPPDVVQKGFFLVLRYWLETLPQHARQHELAWKIHIVGYHGTEKSVRVEIQRFVTEEDPWGVDEFVRWGIGRGEVRADIDPKILGYAMEWVVERFVDRVIDETLHPDVFGDDLLGPKERQRRVDDLMTLVTSAMQPRS